MTFRRALLLVVALAFVIRVGYVVGAKSETCDIVVAGEVRGSFGSECLAGDQYFYSAEANSLARGDGFVEPFAAILAPGETPPAADHPPLTVIVLMPVSWLADHTPLGDDSDANVAAQRYAMVLLGTLLVLLVGLLGRRVGGDRVGIVAAAIAAVSPNVWVNDGLVMSETLTMVLTVAVLLAAAAWYDAPTVRRGLVLGALFGLAGLTRVELLLLVPLVLAPAVVRRAWTPHDRIRRVATSLGVCVLVLAPWVVFNLSRFDEPTFISTNDGLTLAGANCDDTYHGPGTGLWVGREVARCYPDVPAGLDQSEVSTRLRDAGLDYIRAHKSRAVVVAVARVGRTWSLYRPADMIEFNKGEGRESWVTRLGLYAYYPTVVAAIGGAVVLARRRKLLLLWLVLVPALVVTIGSVATYGQTRFRAPAEPSLAVLAAVGIIAACDAFRRRRQVGASTGASSSSSSETVVAAPTGN